MSELAVENDPALTPIAREAASGQVIYLTEHGTRVAGIVSAELAAALERLSAEELEETAAAAAKAGHADAAAFLEDFADRAAVLASRAEHGPSTGRYYLRRVRIDYTVDGKPGWQYQGFYQTMIITLHNKKLHAFEGCV